MLFCADRGAALFDSASSVGGCSCTTFGTTFLGGNLCASSAVGMAFVVLFCLSLFPASFFKVLSFFCLYLSKEGEGVG